MTIGTIIACILFIALTYYSYALLDNYINGLLKNKNNISIFNIWLCMFLGMLPILIPIIGNFLMILFLGIIDTKNRE